MASVCDGCLAMMLAGVPLSQPIAGIAMGLVKEGDQIAILSDIQGSEDRGGDMDFKVAGSGIGITALQMDIKVKGVSRELLEATLGQALEGRRHILRKMLDVAGAPSSDISELAPRFESIKIPGEKIGFLIGPGGLCLLHGPSMRSRPTTKSKSRVWTTTATSKSSVRTAPASAIRAKASADAIRSMCETPKVGTRYTGTVKSIRDFGAFIGVECQTPCCSPATTQCQGRHDLPPRAPRTSKDRLYRYLSYGCCAC